MVNGLNGFVVSNVIPQWSFNGTDTFTYLGPDAVASSGDEILVNGGSALLQFDVGMSTCGGPVASTLTWRPSYENLCGTAFSPPVRNSTISVTNEPTLDITKGVSPALTNFGQPASYTLTLTGANVTSLPTADSPAVDDDDDWTITDTLPAGVSNGVIPSIPSGTRLSIGASTFTDTDTNVAVTAGDALVWRGDREDLTPLPTLTINFVTDGIPFCPPTPPITITNSATLNYPSCGITVNDAANLVLNDSPINSTAQNLSLLNTGPFETGRPDSDGVSGNEANEGDHLQFQAVYRFPAGSGGSLAGSNFVGDLGVSSLAGNPLSLIADPAVRIEVYGSETAVIGVDTPLRSGNILLSQLNNATGTACGGSGFVNGASSFCVPDIDAALTAVGSPGSTAIADRTLLIQYTATAPEGTLDAINTGLPVGGVNDPLKDNNVGAFTERSTITIASGSGSCGGNASFTQGLNSIALSRGTVSIDATINNGNDFDVCGPVNAQITLDAPNVATFDADNIRVEIDGSNYGLVVDGAGVEIADTSPGFDAAITTGGSGNLSSLSINNSRPLNGNLTLEVTPDTADLTGNSSITFPVQLLNTSARTLSGTLFYDSRHTSADFPAEGTTEDYSASFSITPAAASASLDVEFFPPNVILGDPAVMAGPNGVFNWRVRITNVGTSTVSNYLFSNLVPTGFIPDATNSSPNADQVIGQLMVWNAGTLPSLAPGASTEVVVAIQLPQGGGCNVGNPNVSTVRFGCDDGTVLFSENGPDIVFPIIDLQLEHDSDSFCELCREGTVLLDVRNEGASDLYNVVITESLVGSGLEYVPGSTEVSVEGGPGFVAIGDNAATTSTSIRWDSTDIADLGQLLSELNGQPSEMTIRFQVRSADANPEQLVTASRNISASAEFDLFCGDPGLPPTSNAFTVPLRQPQPTVTKLGRNYSARQTVADYADTVFGGTDDIVIWRVDVANSGALSAADLEDLLVSDTIAPGANLTLSHICPSATDANARAVVLEAGGPITDACVAYSADYDVDDPFGNPGNDEPGAAIDVATGGSALVYYLGTVQSQCTNVTNNASIAWGCEANPPAGGINADGSGGNLSAGLIASSDDDSALLSTSVDPSGILISQTFTGTNPSQPVGTKGILTITVTNNSGGTVRDLVLTNTLPTDYELDTTSLGSPLVVNPAFGTYPGIIDDYSLNATDPNAPVFTLISTNNTGTSNQVNLLRNNDQLVLTLGVVRVRPFDATNDPEVRTEVSADGSDPDYAFGAPSDDDNQISLAFDDSCSANPPLSGLPLTDTLNVNIDPEDLDIDINPTDSDLLFILSDPTATLNLQVVVRNNGGHDANDYDTYVTIGSGIDPGTLPTGCAVATPPTELGIAPSNVGGIMPPEYDPTESTTYRCVIRDPLPPSAQDSFSFTVQRALPLGMSGDLTFRADVLARTTLSDSSAPPDRGAAGYPFYSKDNILARIIGFNLSKQLSGNCSEDNPPPVANSNVIIGEDCTLEIEAEWFGFATPGFGNIEIQNARIYEGALSNNPPPVETNPGSDPPNLPDAVDGQGVVSIDTSTSTGGISVAAQNPAAPSALQETALAWRLSTITATGNTQESFVARVNLRTLNDPLNASAAPNLHAALRQDAVNARFDVVFTATGSRLSFDQDSAGYPPASLRTVDLTVTEPNLSVTKQVCNESVSIANNPANSGLACTPFVSLPSIVMGDSDDFFIFRITVSNETSVSGVTRAPAFDLVVGDSMDASDQIIPTDLASDGFDNDGDGLIDGADGNEGSVDNTVFNDGNPADITFDGTHNSALSRLNPGASIALHYRAQLDTMVTPTQQLTNSVGVSYDSLTGTAGAQNAPQGVSGTITGAREYTTPLAQATLQVENIVINPGSKEFLNSSRRDAGLVAGSCASPCVDENAVIGEEVLVELKFTVPLSELRDFSVEDNLPAGIECIEAQDIVLPAFPGQDPGFTPGGTFPATDCTADLVRWDLSIFGDQVLQGTGGTDQFEVQARFIARVQNTATNNNGDQVANGGTATSVVVNYRDNANAPISIAIAEARLTVQEPVLALSQTLDPVPPNTSADSDDVITVSVQLNNTGTSPAYNLELLAQLDADVSYVGNLGGANPPDSVDLTDPTAPRFSYTSALNAGSSFTFTYQVQLANGLQPLQQIDNLVSASFSSLPNNSVALNTGGSIGADGAANGLRNGALPPAGDAVNDYEVQNNANLTIPAVSITKTDLNPTVVPTIGERKQFQLVIELPEGQTQLLDISDSLNAGSTSLLLENNPSFDITYTFQDITSINGTLVTTLTSPAAVEAALVAFNATGSSVNWNFGTVVTPAENDAVSNAINPRLVIDYYARIDNTTSVNAGDTLQNAAVAEYRNGETGATANQAAAAGPYTVVEPLLNVSKVLTPTASPPDAGDTLEYTVTLNNTGGATAYDVNIVDTLSAELTFDTTSSALLDGAPVAGFNATPQGTPGGPLLWGRGQAPSDESLDIPAGSSFVLVYQVVVATNVQPLQPLGNSVLVDWTSLDGISGVERTGDGCPNITAPDDYCALPPATTLISVGDNNTISKTSTSDSYSGTPDDVRIGDTVLYTLNLTIQEGTTENVVVSDTLPPGLEFVATVAINGDGDAPYSAVAPLSYADIPTANTPSPGDPMPLQWTIGTISNVANNDPIDDSFIIVYQARVVDDAAILDPPTPGNTSDNVVNTADLDYTVFGGSAAPTKSDSHSLVVQQPLIDIANISKVRSDGGPGFVEANQTIEFTAQVCNTGTAPAYDLIISDTLPAELNSATAPLPDPNIVSVQVGGVDRTAVYDELGAGFSFAAGVMRWTFDDDPLSHTAPNNCIDIVYRVNVDPEVGAGAIFTNALQVDEYHSLDGDDDTSDARRSYGPVGPVGATVIAETAMAMMKTGPAAATPGDTLVYTLTLPDTPILTTLYNVNVEDDLPTGLTYVSAAFGTGNGAIGLTDNTVVGSDDMRLLIDSVPPGQQAVVDVTVRMNTAVGAAGAAVVNTANYRFASSAGGPVNIFGGSDDHTVTVLEPQPQLTITELGPVSSPGADGLIDLGTPERFNFSVANNLANASTLWQATLITELPPAMRAASAPVIDSLSVNSRVLSETGPDDYDVSYDATSGILQITLKTAAARIEPGETLSLTYTAGLIDDAGNGINLDQRGLLSQWFSQDISAGVPPDTRVFNQTLGAGTPTVVGDDFAHDLSLATRAPELTVTNTVVNLSSGQAPAISAIPGELLQYTLSINNSGALGTTLSLRNEIDALNIPAAFIASPGSLVITSAIDPGWIDNSDANGGVNGSGLIDISNIPISAAGAGNATIQVVFEVELRDSLANSRSVFNQATVSASDLTDILSDDPNTPAANDPTQIVIGSTPEFIFAKTSTDLTDDPNVLQVGDRLRYTIRVNNIGDADTLSATLVDQIPANTQYVANSVTLNGSAVADPAQNISPLRDGLMINSPGQGSGVLIADPSAPAGNIATIIFDVTVNSDLVAGTVISNQATLTGDITPIIPTPGLPLPFEPAFSDDPATDVVGDPTQDIVGIGVNIDAQKTALHLLDVDNDGVIDPGDTLRYTITLVNSGNSDASGVVLSDTLPAEISYLPNSTAVNGVGVADIAGDTPISAAQGGLGITLNAGDSATVIFDATINAVAPGTVIVNQAEVRSDQQPLELTDADGNDENGDQPTEVIVGNVSRLAITKEVFVVDGGVARAGGELEYLITVENIGSISINDAEMTDSIPAGAQLVAGSVVLNGFTNGVVTTPSQIIARHGVTYGNLLPGSSFVVRFRVLLDNGLAIGTAINNTATVRWNAGASSASDSADIDIGGAPGVINLNGRIWWDPDHNAVFANGAERTLNNWTARIYFNNPTPSTADIPIATVSSDANGVFAANGLAPGGPYSIAFAVPDNDPNYPAGSNVALGIAAPSNGDGELMLIQNIMAGGGRNVIDENLPIDPHGVIYNSITRNLIPAGARVSMRRSNSEQLLPDSCFNTPAHLASQQQQIVGDDGFYRFDLNFANGACPAGVSYRIVVELPEDSGFVESVSTVIPPELGPLDTVDCAGDAVAGTSECEVLPLATAPVADIPPGPGTVYFLDVLFDPASRGLFNNHIPIDSVPDGLVSIAKTTPLKTVVRGDLVPYAIELRNPQSFALSGLVIRDLIPPGFKYVTDSAQIDAVASEPLVAGRELSWSNLALTPDSALTVKLLLIVGSGVGDGDYTNTAQAFITGIAEPVSGLASATVRVVPDPTLDCADVLGKVFKDHNADGYPDKDEPGIPGVRLATAQGLLTTTDEYGRFSISCAATPNPDRGSNFYSQTGPTQPADRLSRDQ